MGRAKPLKGQAYADRLDRCIQRREAGWTVRSIAEAEGVHRNTIDSMFRREGVSIKVTKECELVECSTTFTTSLRAKRFCCIEHNKRHDARCREGKTAVVRHCRLPDCSVEVVAMIGDGVNQRKFCSKQHLMQFYSRLRIGYYDKLIERTECFACDYWGPGLHEHHIEFKSMGGSDHPSNLMFLCPSCHTLLRAGLLDIDETGVRDLRESARDDVLSRLEEWDEL